MSLYTDFDYYSLPIGMDQTSYGFLEALRDEALASDTPIGWSEAHGGAWIVTSWEIAREIQKNHEDFKSKDAVSFPPFNLPDSRDEMIVGYDNPEHQKYRQLIQANFSPRRVTSWTEHFRSDANFLIDKFVDRNSVEIVEALAVPVPSRMTAIILGLSPELGEPYPEWGRAMMQGERFARPEWAAQKMRDMREHFEDLLEDHRNSPRDDIISTLLQAEYDGRPLNHDELEDFFVLILLGAIDNTAFVLANIIWRLAWDKELRRRLLNKPDLLVSTIDEFLRYYSTTSTVRKVARDLTVAGVTMTAGQHVVLVHPIINRDPREFPYPDAFIPERQPNLHFAFGLGIHKCLGIHLVRLEIRVIIQEFLRRIPEFDLDPERPATWVTGQLSGMNRVPIVLPAYQESRSSVAKRSSVLSV